MLLLRFELKVKRRSEKLEFYLGWRNEKQNFFFQGLKCKRLQGVGTEKLLSSGLDWIDHSPQVKTQTTGGKMSAWNYHQFYLKTHHMVFMSFQTNQKDETKMEVRKSDIPHESDSVCLIVPSWALLHL